ncbi:hypothetical protein KJ641_00240 [Patescibacteria group bacterium]|nr:hypothetical protein [Patescibacteria group bacterium]
MKNKKVPPGAIEGWKNKKQGGFPSVVDLKNMDEATRRKMADGFRTLGKIVKGEIKPPTEDDDFRDSDDHGIFTPRERAEMIKGATELQHKDMERSGSDKPAGED